MLRAVRFAASLGLEVDPATDAAIRARAGSLAGVSRERIGDEVRRMLSHDSRVRAVQLIQEWSLDKAIFGDDRHGTDWVRLSQVGQDVPLMPALLAAWAMDRGAVAAHAPDEAAAWRSALLLTNAETKGFESCLMTRTRLDGWGNLDVAGRKRLASSRWFSAALSVAAREVPDDAAAIAADVQMLEKTGLAPDRLVTGDDLLADGLHAGPSLGRMLEAIYDAQLRGEVTTRQDALNMAHSLATETRDP
jgi:tRNA nucleotidyltransferase/poly(A) polymerase